MKLKISTPLIGKGLRISTIGMSTDRTVTRILAKLGTAFETKVFHNSTKWEPWDAAYYKTEAAARRGHRKMVSKWKAKSRKEIREQLAKISKG